ncbi:hypothetical protein KBC75_02150 [Candidatus Shapirobacteria bacterium]|nr:hypothetical protein [Candidatus Shapirobacteria bacterium]
MTAKEARELIVSMEVGADTMLKAEGILEIYKDNDEVPEEIINQILKIVDADFDPNKVVGEDDGTDLLI